MNVADFAIADAALRGFRLVREQPRLLLALILFGVLVAAPGATAIDFSLARALPANFSLGAALQPRDPRQVADLATRLAPLWALTVAYDFLIFAIVASAVNRAVLRPADSAFGYLRLGADELRQLIVIVALFLVTLGVYIACLIPAFVVISAVTALARLSGAAPSAALLVAALLACLAVMIGVSLRLSLASPATFAAGRVIVARSWAMTGGRGWRILGTYALAAGLVVVVYFLGSSIILGLTAALGGGPDGARDLAGPPQTGGLAALVTPARGLYLVLSGVLSALIWPVAFAPAAAIFESLSRQAPSGWRQ